MSACNPRLDENDARAYLLSLSAGLMDEIRRDLRDPEAAEATERGERMVRDITSADLRTFGIWQRSLHAYETLAEMVSAARNARARVARSYESMDDFRRDAEAQALGKSPYAHWDAFEHGRRRQLEGTLAARFGAESALLLNGGMSSVATAVGAARLSRGGTIVTGRRGYFQASEYLTRYVAPAGVKLARVPAGNGEAVLEALRATRPQLALFETATIGPGAEVPSRMDEWFAASPETLFVIDNTVQSLLTRWFEPGRADGRRLVVIESATKYLAHRCMAGLAYGPEALVASMRDHARATGQNLQERAFNHIRPAEIEHLPWKMRRHAANVCAFVEELAPADHVDVLTLDSAADPEARRAFFGSGSGAVVVVRLRGAAPAEVAYRTLLSRWQSLARRQGAWVPVRAGFGWSDTTARVLDPARDGPPGGPSYLRISVGIEPEGIVRSLGRALSAACAGAEADRPSVR